MAANSWQQRKPQVLEVLRSTFGERDGGKQSDRSACKQSCRELSVTATAESGVKLSLSSVYQQQHGLVHVLSTHLCAECVCG